MNDMNKPLSLDEFIALNFRYANHWNPNSEYSDKELEGATRILEADLKHFKEEDRDFVIQSFACLIRSIKANKKQLEKWDEKQFQKKGESWQHYDKMIPEFNRVMQSFYCGINGELDHGEKIFPITEIIFKGDLTDEKIVLSGPILAIIKAMFDSFNMTMWDGQKEAMKKYSKKLYEEYEEFMLQWQILTAEGGTIASQLVKNREEDRKESALNRYKYTIANNVHLALKRLVKSNSSASYPSLHKRIIGKLLHEVDLFEYLGYTTDKDIENFIKRGSPENLKTRINKPKK